MGSRKKKGIINNIRPWVCILLLTVYFLLLHCLTGCGRRGDPVLVPSYDERAVEEERAEEKEGEEETAPVTNAEVTEGEEPVVIIPDAPSGVSAVHTGKSVVLVWKEVLKQGVTSYRVYRSSEEGFALAGETVSPAFTDRNIEKNKKYVYRITAVGQSESLPSEEITIETESE